MTQQWQPTNPPTPPVQQGWFARHKVLSMVLGFTLVVLVCCCGGMALVMEGGSGGDGDAGSSASEEQTSATAEEESSEPASSDSANSKDDEPEQDEAESEEPTEEEPADEGDDMSQEQKNAISAAENYLDVMPFSKKGLIEQLSSDAGDGYPRDVAEQAVEEIDADVDWDAQAVKAAKNYQDLMPMSRSEMIQQLSSDAGDGFTQEQAEHAADELGL